ncbi:MAG TPA: TROVE domain-containing protein [Thermoanaerobaculia bacterium]|nr:TROVE domain-containing protein [Thermoanaerobaculia bacterium]
MANKNLFATIAGKLAPNTDAVNQAGGLAYALTPKQALAQYAATGCLNRTFYASAEKQLETVLSLCASVDDLFIARTAIYCRERGFMKDMPALLCAVLATRNAALLESIFPRVIDNGKMLRNFVQIVRSGVTGRKSLGTAPKRMIRRWLDNASHDALFRASVGQSPSLADVIRMVHPKPDDKAREALYGYLIGRPHDVEKLPALVMEYEAFKRGATSTVPDVPFQMLTSLELDTAAWTAIARNAPWQMTRMNLNTFARHGVFANEEVTKLIAARLADPDAVRKARVFPYHLLSAFLAAGDGVPLIVRDALQDAMEIATQNVPAIDGKVYVCADVSGSMHAAATGARGTATSAVRCIDVAALVAASRLRKNPSAEVLPFDTKLVSVDVNARDSVMTNARKLAAIGGGGTACSVPLEKLNKRNAYGELVIYVSDNESWADPERGRGTKMMKEWNAFKHRNPNARLVCIDVQPNRTTQAIEREDVLNVGGFSDAVFTLTAEFAAGRLGAGHWTEVIENVALAESAVA